EDLGEAGVFGKEAVTRMHRVGAGDLAGRDDRRDVEVAFLGGRAADAHALVGEPDVHGVGVSRRMDRYGRDAKLLAGPFDAKRDLSPVGDEDLVEHSSVSMARPP